MISIIVAIARGNVIGAGGHIPWYIPADLQYFKDTTVGHAVIMGRKTYDSIVKRLGRPLPDRKNIVVTRDRNFSADGVIVAHSLEDAVRMTDTNEEVFVIGGEQIYKLALPYTDRLYVTEVEADIASGDTFFPDIDKSVWHEVARTRFEKTGKNEYNHSFVVYDKRA